jgi:tetratricopeptide (TPR) repeat protein
VKNSNHYYESGIKKNLDGRYDEAIVDYTRAAELDPNDENAFLRRGELFYKVLKRYEKALTDFESAIRLNPDNAYSYLQRGIVRCHLLQFAEALEDFDKAIGLAPNDERVYLNRGKTKHMLKCEKLEVIGDLIKAMQLGSPQAGELIELFYGDGKGTLTKKIEAALRKPKK